MSDTNQQCPSNWTLTTSPVRGCGRTTRGWYSCDSAFYSVNSWHKDGVYNYSFYCCLVVHQPNNHSTVCGRINAYQKGGSFLNFRYIRKIQDMSNISGITVTHWPAGNRSLMWNNSDTRTSWKKVSYLEQWHTDQLEKGLLCGDLWEPTVNHHHHIQHIIVPVLILMYQGQIFLHLWLMIIFVILEIKGAFIPNNIILKTHYGMGGGVVLLARAVPSTPLPGFASLSLSLPVRTWRYDFVIHDILEMRID